MAPRVARSIAPMSLNGAAGTPTVPASPFFFFFDDGGIHDATNTKILFQWQFVDDTAIAEHDDRPAPRRQMVAPAILR